MWLSILTRVLTSLSLSFSLSYPIPSPFLCCLSTYSAFLDLVRRFFSSPPSNFPHCLTHICFLFPSFTSGTLSIILTVTSPSRIVLSVSLSCFLFVSLSVTKTSAFRAPNSFYRPPPHLSSSSRAASQSS